jgi:hypothetical protein
MNKYEGSILPVETEGEYPARIQPESPLQAGAKIIPFPGVSIDSEVTYQNALDDFFREIGYIE